MPLFSHPVRTGTPNIGDRERFHRLIDEILDRGWLTNNGPVVREFERRIAEYLGVRHCVAVSNGTVAIEVAARALGLIGEVVVPAFTFVASAHAISWLGLEPVFCDIDEETLCIDPACASSLITERTSAIMGVHVYGRTCDTESLESIGLDAGIPVFYDAAHALGCSRRGRMVGSFGLCETFSFHATKFFNTFEGGAITTNDDALAHEMRRCRSFGLGDPSGSSESLGTNAKMTEVAAAMGLVNLDILPQVLERNHENYDVYRDVLDAVPGLSILEYDSREANNYQYVVLELDDPFPLDASTLQQRLEREGVFVRRYFFPAVHLQKPYAPPGHAAPSLPIVERVSERVIALPTGLAVTPDDARAIAAFIASML